MVGLTVSVWVMVMVTVTVTDWGLDSVAQEWAVAWASCRSLQSNRSMPSEARMSRQLRVG
jgi:hypothetical protein